MRSQAFTLLEVMVAVAILGLSLTAILSAQAGAFSSAAQARTISVATGLARCKMSELEEHLIKEGFQELDESDTGPCCEGDESPNIRCSWRIEKPEFPEPKFGELNLDTDVGSSDLGALGVLAKGGKNIVGPDAKLGDISSVLGDASAPGAGLDGMIGMLMELVYPDLKILFEASSRRVTVKTSWTMGEKEYSMELVQWVTNPQGASTPGGSDAVDQAADALEQLTGGAPDTESQVRPGRPQTGGFGTGPQGNTGPRPGPFPGMGPGGKGR